MDNVKIYICCYGKKSLCKANNKFKKYSWAKPILINKNKNIFFLNLIEIFKDHSKWENNNFLGIMTYTKEIELNLDLPKINDMIKNIVKNNKNYFHFFKLENKVREVFNKNDKIISLWNNTLKLLNLKDTNDIKYNFWIAKKKFFLEYITWQITELLKVFNNSKYFMDNPEIKNKLSNQTKNELQKLYKKNYYPIFWIIKDRIVNSFFDNLEEIINNTEKKTEDNSKNKIEDNSENKIEDNSENKIEDNSENKYEIKLDNNLFDKNLILTQKIYNKFIIFVPYCDVYYDFIIKCFDSIEEQRYNNYEVIIINDGGKKTDIINEYILLKNLNKKYKLINFENNNGPAFSKWKFIEYIQNNIENYSVNDIAIIIDGDDYIYPNALNIINNKYLNNKCWCTFGEATGKYCDISNNFYNKNKPNMSLNRNETWCANHPRTFKLFLLLEFKKKDFMYKNKWLKKGTDRPLMYNIFELCGNNKICHIDETLYYYREHSNNSYKTVSTSYKKEVLNYIEKCPKKNKIIEDIHVVMCCWKRYQNLNLQINNLYNQMTDHKIHLHLINNNYDKKDELENIVNKNKKIYKKFNIHLKHYKNKYFGYQRFIYIRDIIIKKYQADYVIIIDDDQLFNYDWIQKMWNLREPKIYTGWYGKRWVKNNDYWSGSVTNITQCKRNELLSIKNLDYIGTGGSLIDISIFNNKSNFWKIPNDLPEKKIFYNIEDLWLSFIAKYNFDYQLKRTFLPPSIDINKVEDESASVCLFENLRDKKQILLNYLFNQNSNIYIKKERILVLFDVDGTLTESRREIKQETINILLKLKNIVDIGIVGGSNLKKQKEQLLEKNLNLFKYIFSENGLVAYKNGELIKKTSIIDFLGEKKIKILINISLDYMSRLDIPKKRGTFIEFRNGMINLCPVGRNCSLEDRLEFFEYDKKNKIRENMVKYLSNKLKNLNLSFSIGGQISIDVFPKGWDKTYCLQFVKDEYERILFFGDRTNKGGNDYEIFNSKLTEGYAINSPEETISKLNELFDL